MTCREPLRRSYVAALLLALAPLGLVHCGQPVEYGEQGHTKFTGPAYLTVGGVLTGRHAEIACESCHVGETAPFGTIPDHCLGCHEDDRPTPNHEPDATSCNQGCHRVVDYCWNFATNPDCVPATTSGDADTDADADADTDVDTDTDTDTGTVPTGNSCAIGGCHGDGPIRDDAAPASSSHNAHLAANYDLFAPAAPMNCDTCHPAGGDTALTHENGTVDVPLAGITVGDNAAAAYAGGTCSGTYCHGASMADAPPDPVWDSGRGAVSCGSTCHVSPPVNMYDSTAGGAVAGHPPINSCSTCHSPTGGGDPTTLADKTLHINGTVEY